MSEINFVGKSVATLESIIARCKAQLGQDGAATELAPLELVKGQTYQILRGKIGNEVECPATFIASRVIDGKQQLKFSVDEGDFGEATVIVGDTKVVLYDADGNPYTRKATRTVDPAVAQARLDAALAELPNAEAREALVIGKEYTIVLGRAETRREVQAVLLGERKTDAGFKQYRFYYGSGFDTEVVTLTSGYIKNDAVDTSEEASDE